MTSQWRSSSDAKAELNGNSIHIRKREVNPYSGAYGVQRKSDTKFVDFTGFARGSSQQSFPPQTRFNKDGSVPFLADDGYVDSSTPKSSAEKKTENFQQDSPSAYINKGLLQFQRFLARRTVSNNRSSYVPPRRIPSGSSPLFQNVDDTYILPDEQYFEDDSSVYTLDKRVIDASLTIGNQTLKILWLILRFLVVVLFALKDSVLGRSTEDKEEEPELGAGSSSGAQVPGSFPRKVSLLSRLVSAASSSPVVAKNTELYDIVEQQPRVDQTLDRSNIFDRHSFSRPSDGYLYDDANDSMVVSSFVWDQKTEPKAPVRKSEYGSRFFPSKFVSQGEPDIEADYFKKVFNKDGLFEVDLRGVADFKEKNYKQGSETSINKFSEFSKRLRSMLPDSPLKKEEPTTYHGDDWMITGVSRKEPDVINFEEEFKAYQAVMEQKKKRQELVNLARLKESSVVKPLPADRLQMVNRFWTSRDENTVVSKNFGVTVKVVDFLRLRNGRWLNDTIMDFYFAMMVDRSRSSQETRPLPKMFAFTTHFYTTLASRGYTSVARWAKKKKVDVTDLDYVFVPVNVGTSHWTLAVINNKKQCYEYYDSLGASNPSVFNNLAGYMVDESTRIHGSASADYHSWKGFNMKTPQQQNGFDCGVFTCTVGEYLSRGKPLTFSQSDMKVLRERMGYEIISSEFIN
ncbi:unnamed protein product [Kuraishia capsulata CBS 1993]|uniref:Ubiquitin-like protease family profile domain-containing protein n=1 Tax=Kuraishia capsulata CBS 1993 TaxID=1382522 RepID=W6MHW7_9ASCO|nr:uncharacterized protein KUCA_T00001606001 [Kuraishia capsulata CBS 1993]CDK25636.1 unnamed protein product [Kuraishia capsulata CBS 1993]